MIRVNYIMLKIEQMYNPELLTLSERIVKIMLNEMICVSIKTGRKIR